MNHRKTERYYEEKELNSTAKKVIVENDRRIVR